jgi:hypothetical protein
MAGQEPLVFPDEELIVVVLALRDKARAELLK